MLIFAIDPGREKCGIALFDSITGLIFKKVIDSEMLIKICKEQLITHNDVKVIMGNGTSSKEHQKNIKNLLRDFGQELELVDEYFLVTFDNGEFIHYDYYGKAYLSLNPQSKLYKLRLSRYDIKQII